MRKAVFYGPLAYDHLSYQRLRPALAVFRNPVHRGLYHGLPAARPYGAAFRLRDAAGQQPFRHALLFLSCKAQKILDHALDSRRAAPVSRCRGSPPLIRRRTAGLLSARQPTSSGLALKPVTGRLRGTPERQ